MKVSTEAWGEFRIGDLFELRKGARLTKANMVEGGIRFVSAANINNGVTAHIGNNDHVHSEGTITVCYNGNGGTGKAFYQDKPFWASDDVHVLYPKFHLPESFDGVERTGLNAAVGLFLASAIEKVGRQKYGFTDKWKLAYMQEDKIKLPVKNDGSPDWPCIESFCDDVLNSTDHQLNALSAIRTGKSVISSDSWGKFQVGDLFDVLLAKGDMKPQRLELGEIPLVSAGNERNGIAMYCSRRGDGKSEIFDAGAITVSMFGQAFYQPRKFFAVSHGRVNILKPRTPITEGSGLFIACVLSRSLKGKFDYATMCTSERLSNVSITLPKTDEGNPDWHNMDSFMKDVLVKAYVTFDAVRATLKNRDT